VSDFWGRELEPGEWNAAMSAGPVPDDEVARATFVMAAVLSGVERLRRFWMRIEYVRGEEGVEWLEAACKRAEKSVKRNGNERALRVEWEFSPLRCPTAGERLGMMEVLTPEGVVLVRKQAEQSWGLRPNNYDWTLTYALSFGLPRVAWLDGPEGGSNG
jgi:hypothetical protein